MQRRTEAAWEAQVNSSSVTAASTDSANRFAIHVRFDFRNFIRAIVGMIYVASNRVRRVTGVSGCEHPAGVAAEAVLVASRPVAARVAANEQPSSLSPSVILTARK